MNVAVLALCAINSFIMMAIMPQYDVTYLNTPEGSKRLINSSHQNSYWQLSIYLDTQKEPTYCGVASAIMVLNALEIDRPPWKDKSNFKLFMQEHFFTPEVEQIITKQKAASKGIDLFMLAQAIKTFGVSVELIKGTDLTLDTLRKTILRTLHTKDTYMIANYYRPAVKQTGTGHFSPIAAYDEESDSVLVMDVARYRYPPTWVPLTMLLESMQAFDNESGSARGLLIVSKP